MTPAEFFEIHKHTQETYNDDPILKKAEVVNKKFAFIGNR